MICHAVAHEQDALVGPCEPPESALPRHLSAELRKTAFHARSGHVSLVCGSSGHAFTEARSSTKAWIGEGRGGFAQLPEGILNVEQVG
jgi:hypothetical protein